MDKPKVAYIVSNGESRAEIVYETNGAAARRIGGREMHLEFEEVESCYRARDLDQFAPHGPTAKYMIEERNWQFCCCKCSDEVSQLTENRQYDKYDDAYCSPECLAAHSK